jgi:hypothetical protein
MGRARLGEYLLGIEGLALIRSWMSSDAASSAARMEEIAGLVTGGSGLASTVLDLPELEVSDGYRAWAATYDGLPNPLILLEEPLVRAWIDRSLPGRALDAACGTADDWARARALSELQGGGGVLFGAAGLPKFSILTLPGGGAIPK